MSTTVTHPLRLPRSLKAAAERLAKAEGVSLNQLVVTAIVAFNNSFLQLPQKSSKNQFRSWCPLGARWGSGADHPISL
jgi:hypothetical protein